MTDEEKAEELVKENVCKKCGSKVCGFLIRKCDIALPRYEGVLVGLAEGRKEVTYMKAEEYDQYLDACRKNIELEKDRHELLEKIKAIKEVFNIEEIYRLVKENAELKEKVKGYEEMSNRNKRIKERIENICSQYVSNELAYKIKEIIWECKE